MMKPGFSQPVYLEEEAKNFLKYLVEGLKSKLTEESSAIALAKLCLEFRVSRRYLKLCR